MAVTRRSCSLISAAIDKSVDMPVTPTETAETEPSLSSFIVAMPVISIFLPLISS